MKKDKIIIAIIVASLIATAIGITIAVQSARAEKPLSAAEMLSLGEKYLLEMEYEQAIVHFTSLIEIEPKNARAYTGLAEAYLGAGDTDKAADALRKGLEQLPDNHEITDMLDALIVPEQTPESSPAPVETPTPAPSEEPTPEPTTEPTEEPTEIPSEEPADEPSPMPTVDSTPEPSLEPLEEPVSVSTTEPSPTQSLEPITEPTLVPTASHTPKPFSIIPDDVKAIFVQLATAFENEDYDEVWLLSGDSVLLNYLSLPYTGSSVKYNNVIVENFYNYHLDPIYPRTHCHVEYYGQIVGGSGVWYSSYEFFYENGNGQEWTVSDMSQYGLTGSYNSLNINPDRSLSGHTYGEIKNGQMVDPYNHYIYWPNGYVQDGSRGTNYSPFYGAKTSTYFERQATDPNIE